MLFLGLTQPHGWNIKNLSAFWWKKKSDESHLREVWKSPILGGHKFFGLAQKNSRNQATSILAQRTDSTVPWEGSTMGKGHVQLQCNHNSCLSKFSLASKISQLRSQALDLNWWGGPGKLSESACKRRRQAQPWSGGQLQQEGTALVVQASPWSYPVPWLL